MCAFNRFLRVYRSFNAILDGGGADELGSLVGDQPMNNPRMSVIANATQDSNGINISVIKASPAQQSAQNNGALSKKSTDQAADRKISQTGEKSSGAGSTKPAQKKSRACTVV